MATKRMFSRDIIESDLFLEMPLTTQALYFHLGMRADDEGFINSPKKILREINCSNDDLRLLIAKGYVICFESGVIVITHWNMNNTIRKDRLKPTIYFEEKAKLAVDKNEKYILTDTSETVCIQADNQMTTNPQPNGNQMTPQYSIDKNRLDKISIDIVSANADGRNTFDYNSVVNLFNSICTSLPQIKKLTDKRRKAIKSALKILDGDFKKLFEMVESSDFLTGRSGRWSGCGFDWILQSSNLVKILEGNYSNKQQNSTSNATYDLEEYEKSSIFDE